jgi:hypothetical protein
LACATVATSAAVEKCAVDQHAHVALEVELAGGCTARPVAQHQAPAVALHDLEVAE